MAETSVEPGTDAPRILVVDDEEHVCLLVTRILERHGYQCTPAFDGAEALEKLNQNPYDVALIDIMMPNVSGLEVIEQMAVDRPDVATIMVTAVDDPAVADKALDLGAYGYIIKPFATNEILINVTNALRRRELERKARAHQEELEQTVAARTAELSRALQEIRASREETVQRLAKAAEFRDNETAQHIQRMSHYCALLAAHLGFDAERCEQIRLASTMHDVGKIGIPDEILLKPGRYTEEEYAIMKRHAEIGARILGGSNSDLLNLAATIAQTHHERIDGTGYPLGLSGDEIPLEGRIAAVADVFDALTSRRVYKDAFPIATAIGIMQEGRGTQFDAALLDVFLSAMPEVTEVQRRYADHQVAEGATT